MKSDSVQTSGFQGKKLNMASLLKVWNNFLNDNFFSVFSMTNDALCPEFPEGISYADFLEF